jgi:hypothetical protein
MKLALRLAILSFFVALLIAGCGNSTGGNQNSATIANTPDPNAPRTGVEELGLLINVPYEAEDCIWKQDPSTKAITAVLRFDAEDTGKLASDVQKLGAAQEASIPMQTWFPGDMVVDSDLRGDDQLRGKSYAADPFFQDPYTSGRLLRIGGTDYWILEVQPKS